MIPLLKQRTFFDLFPVPQFLLLSTIGIAVTDDDVKVAQLRRDLFGDGFRLAYSSKVTNPKKAAGSELTSDPDKLTLVLKDLSLRYGIRYAHVALPEEKTYLFTAMIDRVPTEGIRDAVAFIVEENAPVSLAESVFDFEVIGEDKNSDKIKLTVSVLPKSIVETYVKLFKSAGITPVSFEIVSQAIARAVIQYGDKRPYLIINISSSKTGFYVVDEEVVQFSTTVVYGVGEDNSYSNLNDLKAEMRKVFAFWETRLNSKEIQKVIICGFGASKKDFVEKLMSEGHLPYKLADVWVNMSPSRGHVPEISTEESLDYASVIGLGLPRAR